MWAFFSRRLRMWLLLAIALPLTRALVHRVALAAERRDPSTRTAKALHQADSTVTAVSRRTARKAERRKAGADPLPRTRSASKPRPPSVTRQERARRQPPHFAGYGRSESR
jgi:hypothetical protein